MSLKRRWALPILARPTLGAHTSLWRPCLALLAPSMCGEGEEDNGTFSGLAWRVARLPLTLTTRYTVESISTEACSEWKNFLGDGWGRSDNG